MGQNQQLCKKGRASKYTTYIDPLVCTQIQGNVESRQDANYINPVVSDTADRHIGCQEIPFVGWLDEIASLSVTYNKVCKNITPEMEAKVDDILDRWFPEYTAYELIEE